MKYKKEIEKLLFLLKNADIDRGKIEKELHYSENYIDQILAKGGNKKFYLNLRSYTERVLQKEISEQDEITENLGGDWQKFNLSSNVKDILQGKTPTTVEEPDHPYGDTVSRLLTMLEKAQNAIFKEQDNVSKAHDIIKLLADKVPKEATIISDREKESLPPLKTRM